MHVLTSPCRSYRMAALTSTLVLLACGGCANPPAEEIEISAAARPQYEVVFSGTVGDAQELFGMSISGDDRHRLTTLSGFADFPVWSPSGSRILFLAMADETSNLLVMDAATGEISGVVTENGNPADWGPDGERILITAGIDGGGRGLFIVDLDGGDKERVDTGSSEDAYARWSPAGDALTYESGRDGNPEIYWTSLETGETRRLTDNQILDEWPSFSPDGSHIAWASGGEEDKNLWIMRADGSEKRQVTRDMMFGDAFPEWSPDGRQILLTVRRSEEFVLELIDLETGNATHLGAGTAPSWR